MEKPYLLNTTKHNQCVFESTRRTILSTRKFQEGILHVTGIVHFIYSKVPFVLGNYGGVSFTSQAIDAHNYLLHFPRGIPMCPRINASLWSLDPGLDVVFEVHMESIENMTFSRDSIYIHTNKGITSVVFE